MDKWGRPTDRPFSLWVAKSLTGEIGTPIPGPGEDISAYPGLSGPAFWDLADEVRARTIELRSKIQRLVLKAQPKSKLVPIIDRCVTSTAKQIVGAARKAWFRSKIDIEHFGTYAEWTRRLVRIVIDSAFTDASGGRILWGEGVTGEFDKGLEHPNHVVDGLIKRFFVDDVRQGRKQFCESLGLQVEPLAPFVNSLASHLPVPKRRWRGSPQWGNRPIISEGSVKRWLDGKPLPGARVLAGIALLLLIEAKLPTEPPETITRMVNRLKAVG